MKQKSSQAEDKMSHVGREISLLTGKVSHVENEVSLLTGKVTHVENELSHLSVTVTHLADTVTHLEGKVTVVERKVDDLGENLTNFRLEVKDEIWKLKIYLILLAVLMLITNPTVLELVTKLIGIFK
jgi:chromosome segregation ATPase